MTTTTRSRKAADAPKPETEPLNRRVVLDFFTDALLFTDPSGMMPVLDAVMLSTKDGYLHAVSTDRYVLCDRRMPWTGRPDVDDFLLDGDDTRDLVRVLRGSRSVVFDLTITDTLTMRAGSITLETPPKPGEFPRYRKLVADSLAHKAAEHVGNVALNGKILAKFTRLSSRDPLAITTTGPTHPVIIRAGQDFTGIQMPVRLDSKPWASVAA